MARLPTSVVAAYEADPLIADLLRMSSGGTPVEVGREPPHADVVAASLRTNGIRWIVVDRKRASSRLVNYVNQVMRLTAVAHDDERWLYFVNLK